MKFFLLLLITHHLLMTNSFAQSNLIKLNEIQIEPEQRVELINLSEEDVDVSNYYIDDDGGSTFFKIPVGSVIPTGKCLLVTGNFNFNKTTSDKVRLFSKEAEPVSPNAILLDTFSYQKSPGEYFSFQRSADLSVWNIKDQTLGFFNDQQTVTCIPATPTPTEKLLILPTASLTTTPSPTPTRVLTVTQSPMFTSQSAISPTPQLSNVANQITASSIFISEILPNPDGEEVEWVEIFNNTNEEINLSSFMIDDKATTGSSPRAISGIIKPNGYFIVKIDPPMLNNSFDDVRLLSNNQSEVDKKSYSYTKKGYSYGVKNNSSDFWCLQVPTPNTVNGACLENIITSIDNLKENDTTSQDKFIDNNIILDKNEKIIKKTTQNLNKNHYFSSHEQIYMSEIHKLAKINYQKSSLNIAKINHSGSFLAATLSLISFFGVIAKIVYVFKKNSF